MNSPSMREPVTVKCMMPKTKARWATCNGGFGLIRYRYGYKKFCSKQCLDRYLAKTTQRVSNFKQRVEFFQVLQNHSFWTS